MTSQGRARRGLSLAIGVVACAVQPAAASELFGGVGWRGAPVGIAICCYEQGADIQAGLRTAPLAAVLGGELRGQAFASADLAGRVDFAAAGLVLRWPLAGGRFYVQPGLGGAVHDGPGEKYQARPDRLYLGSRLLFAPEVSLGWRLSEKLALELNLLHLSHARLGGRQNPGLDDVAVRVAYRFGG